jgi:hypothetical protein
MTTDATVAMVRVAVVVGLLVIEAAAGAGPTARFVLPHEVQ